MNRPWFVALLGWPALGLTFILFVACGAMLLGVSPPDYPWAAPLAALKASGSRVLLICTVAAAAALLIFWYVLEGRRWARILLLIAVVVALGVGVHYAAVLRESAFVRAWATSSQFNALGLVVLGLGVALICSLFSPRAGTFFHPKGRAVPFPGYDLARLGVLIAALGVAGLGSYKLYAGTLRPFLAAKTAAEAADAAEAAQAALRSVPVRPPEISPANARAGEAGVAAKPALLPALRAQVHTFTSLDGQQMRARLINFNGVHVTIEREDGRIFTNSITVYSEADQTYIRAQTQ
jgi:hypothetical protein